LSNEENQNDKADEKRLAGMVLSSKSETELVENLIESEKRFSELKERLDWTSGRLHYHILRLRASGFVAQGPKGYHLTEKGKKIAKKYL
jgi:predicted transcriptional regulator